MRDSEDIALTGSSAAKNLGLAAPDTIDAYPPADRLATVIAVMDYNKLRGWGQRDPARVPGDAW